MAQKRMISQSVFGSARFLKMPISAQALYAHLVVRADDDGIVEAFSVMRITGNSEDDLKILVAKQFIVIIDNDELIAYVTNWLEQNSIRADRKIDSRYQYLLLKVMPDVELIHARQRSDCKICKTGQSNVSPLPDNGRHRIEQISKDIYKTTTKGSTENSVCQVDKSVDNIKNNGINLLVEKYGKVAVDEKLLLFSVQKNVRNPVAWLRKALEEDWKKENHVALNFGRAPNLDCKKCNGTGYETRIEMLTGEEIIVKCDCCR